LANKGVKNDQKVEKTGFSTKIVYKRTLEKQKRLQKTQPYLLKQQRTLRPINLKTYLFLSKEHKTQVLFKHHRPPNLPRWLLAYIHLPFR
jgi:hypothetical protein